MNNIRNDLYFELYETRRIPEVCLELRYIRSSDGNPGETVALSKKPFAPAPLYHLRNVPSYLHTEFLDEYRLVEIPDQNGLAISLEGINQLEDYLGLFINSRLRGMVRNNPKKLDVSGEVNKQRYCGAISKEHYNFLMTRMKSMLVQRFAEKGVTNERVPEWDRLVELFYPLILEEKASLYEIRLGEEPIAIAFNYHLWPVLFPAILAYDPQYGRFGLGHMLIADQITWCLEQGYKMIDMSMGDLRYKHDWCNRKYTFSTLLVYKKNSLPVFFSMLFIACRLHAKRYLKKKGVHLIYHRIRRRLKTS